MPSHGPNPCHALVSIAVLPRSASPSPPSRSMALADLLPVNGIPLNAGTQTRHCAELGYQCPMRNFCAPTGQICQTTTLERNPYQRDRPHRQSGENHTPRLVTGLEAFHRNGLRFPQSPPNLCPEWRRLPSSQPNADHDRRVEDRIPLPLCARVGLVSRHCET